MATADSVKAKIQGLINTANETTGKNDATLTEAVNHLKEGYGQGGGDSDFWDKYQDNGNRTDYLRAFGGIGWNDETFKPKHSIRPVNSTNMFSDCRITNLKKLMEDRGLELDFSGITYNRVSQVFSDSKITDLGIIDVSSCASIGYLFYRASNLVNIEKLILSSDGKTTFAGNEFTSCSALKEIRVEGVIGKTGFNTSSAKSLSKASIESIINALSTTTSGLTVTLSKAAVDRISTEEEYGSYVWWYTLAGDGTTDGIRPNWTISLA